MPGLSDWHEVGVAVSSEVVVKREARDAKLDWWSGLSSIAVAKSGWGAHDPCVGFETRIVVSRCAAMDVSRCAAMDEGGSGDLDLVVGGTS